jgi:AcrR family transcriptional regulator
MKTFPAERRNTVPLNRHDAVALDRPLRQRAIRGRPIDTRIEHDVVLAVLNLLKTKSYRHVTIERIARTVKRARTSLYRRWPSKRHLVAYAVVSTLAAEPAPDTGSLRRDLICAVDTLRRAFAGTLGQALPGLLADMAHDQELARMIREEVLMRRRTSIKNALTRGIARGEINSRVQIDVLIDLLTAPCYFRVLFRHARITRPFVKTVVDYALRAARLNAGKPRYAG